MGGIHWVVDGGVEDERDGDIAKLDQMGLGDYVAIHEAACETCVGQFNKNRL